jgi:hypothetical protein
MKVDFLSKLNVQAVEDNKWMVVSPFLVRVDGEVITVPEGYETDFASIPRLPFVFLVFGNTAHRSAVIHDYLYARGVNLENKRAWCDKVFYTAMELDGLPKWRRLMMYLGVRVGGASHFNYFKEPSNG